MSARGRELIERLHEHVVVGDGAMGSRLYELGVPSGGNFDHLNLTHPDLVRRVHAEYLDAGAELLETNAFSASRLKLAAFGLADHVVEINRQAVLLARQVAGTKAFVAGTVGPAPSPAGSAGGAELAESAIRESFREQIVALADAGADVIMLETFTDLEQIQWALAEARAACDLPIIAQMTFPDGRNAPDGSEARAALGSLVAGGASVVGTNCGRGVAKVLRAVEYLSLAIVAPLSAFPNAGMPEQVGGRMFYLMTPAYFAEGVERMVRAGAALVGGCCGTRAADIAAAVERVRELRPAKRMLASPLPSHPPAGEGGRSGATVSTCKEVPLRLPEFLRRSPNRLPVLVEIDPPKGADLRDALRGARLLKDAGADAVTLGDSPLATLRMDSVIFGSIIERELDLPAVCHVACRDRNLIGMQSLLLGAHALGVRNILAITGDPAKLGDHPDATSVYNLNSIKLVELIARLNGGRNHSGQSIDRPTEFAVGVAFNPNARDLGAELSRLARKVERGAQFALTQAVFDAETMRRACELARPLGIPIFAGIYPLLSSRNAEFMHNEFPGIVIAESVRRRMASAGPDKSRMAAEGMAIAIELADAFRESADGLYLIAPLNRARVAAELLAHIRAKA